jgi:hypothetical protein
MDVLGAKNIEHKEHSQIFLHRNSYLLEVFEATVLLFESLI